VRVAKTKKPRPRPIMVPAGTLPVKKPTPIPVRIPAGINSAPFLSSCSSFACLLDFVSFFAIVYSPYDLIIRINLVLQNAKLYYNTQIVKIVTTNVIVVSTES